MNKRKAYKANIYFSDDSSSMYFDGEMTFSESYNSRKGGQSWKEFHLSWIIYDEPETVPQKSSEEIEAEAIARSKEKMKNPLYAGTQDGRDFYHTPPPTFESWQNFIAELGKENKNGKG